MKKGLNLNKSLRKLKDFSPLWRFKVTATVKPYTKEEFGILWTENSAAAPHPIHFPFMDLSKSLVPPDSFSSSPYRSGISLGGPYSVCRDPFHLCDVSVEFWQDWYETGCEDVGFNSRRICRLRYVFH